MVTTNLTSIIKKAVQEIILPEIRSELQEVKTGLLEVKAEIKVLPEMRAELQGVKSELQEFKAEVKSELQGVKSEIQEVKAEIKLLHSEIRCLDEHNANIREDIRTIRGDFRLAIEIHERLAALEARLPH